jgi:anaphase-promoting complex subunit 5
MSEMTSQVFLRCHAKNSSFDDELKAVCRLAGLLSGKGKYEEAFGMLESMDKNSLRGAKTNQFWHLYRGLLKLRRDLHHNNLDSAEHLLSQLLQIGQEILEPDMIYVIDTLHIELLIRRNDFEAAFTKIDRLITELREDDRDIAHRIRLLLYKTRLFDCIGRPEKGFTIVMRAVSMAWRARQLRILWQAVGALANILNALGEFAAAAEILTAVLPRCLESDSAFIVGMLYSTLADAWTGQAGEDRPWAEAKQMRRRDELMVKAHGALDSAFKYFSQVEDVEKQCEVMAKKATLMKAVGDNPMAEEYAAKFLALKREGMTRIG